MIFIHRYSLWKCGDNLFYLLTSCNGCFLEVRVISLLQEAIKIFSPAVTLGCTATPGTNRVDNHSNVNYKRYQKVQYSDNQTRLSFLYGVKQPGLCVGVLQSVYIFLI